MSRLLLPLLLIVVCLGAWAQEVNMQDPAEVAKAYLQACEKWDLEAAAKLLDADEATALQGLAKEPGANMAEQILMELLCVPMNKHTKYTIGETVVNADECQLKVVATYTIPQTYVLRKGEDGQWRVSLRDSILSTTGAADVYILQGRPIPSRTLA